MAGEGLAGVLVAFLVTIGVAPKSMDARLPGLAGELGGLLLAMLVCLFLYRAGRDVRK